MTGHDLKLIREFLDMTPDQLGRNMGTIGRVISRVEGAGPRTVWRGRPDRIALVWWLVDIRQGVTR